MPMLFEETKLKGAYNITINQKSDERGFFARSWDYNEFKRRNLDTNIVQCNVSFSKKRGTLRGLHFQQNPKAQAKLVSVVSGKIFDVAVDIRKNSPTFGKWVSEILSHENHKSLFIPSGFAHGFCVLSNEADVLYKVNNEYSPDDESGIIWNDSNINISWPTNNPIISNKDKQYPTLENSKNNFL